MNQAVKTLIENQIRNLPNGKAELSLLSNENDTSLVFCREGNVFRESCTDNPVHHIRIRQMMPFIKEACSLNPEANITFLLNTCDHTEGFSLDEKYPTLCFCKTKDQKAATIPNIDFYSGLLSTTIWDASKTDIPYEEKQTGSIFIGASTGWGDRLRYCESVHGSPKHHGYINQVVGEIDKKEYPHFDVYTSLPFVGVGNQLRFKFLINIDGFGLCYSRLYWQMSSNSIPVYLNRNKNFIQLYDYFLEPNVHYIESTIEEWPEKFEYLTNTEEGKELCKEVSRTGKKFCAEFLGDLTHEPVNIWCLAIKELHNLLN